MEGVTLTLCRFEEDDEKMIAQASNYYTINVTGQLFMDVYIKEFRYTLTEVQRSFYTNLIQNMDERNMTQEELAQHLGYSLSTFKRRREELREAWLSYTADY